MEKKPSWKVVICILGVMALLAMAGLLLAKLLVGISYSSRSLVYERQQKEMEKVAQNEELGMLEFDEKYDVDQMIFGIPERLYVSDNSDEESLEMFNGYFSGLVDAAKDRSGEVTEFSTNEDGTLPGGDGVTALYVSMEDTRGLSMEELLGYDYLYFSCKEMYDCEEWVAPVYFSGLYGVFRVSCSDGDLYFVNDFYDVAVGRGPCMVLGYMYFSSDFNFYISTKDSLYIKDVGAVFSKYTNWVDYEGRRVLGSEIRVLHEGGGDD